MRKLTISINKGGVGKTMFVKSLSAAAADAGLNVLGLDLDSQRNFATWGKRRNKEGIVFPIVKPINEQDLEEELRRAEKAGCDLVIIDTPPGKNTESLAAMEAADHILIPFWNDQDAYEGVARSWKTAQQLGKTASGALNFATPNSITHEITAAGVLKGIGLEMAPVVVHRYDVHRQASAMARVAQELEPNSTAADEIRKLWVWLDQRLQLCTIAKGCSMTAKIDANKFLENMALGEEEEAPKKTQPKPQSVSRPKPEPAPRVLQPSVKRRKSQKHIGGYFDSDTLERIALLRARLDLDNSELLKLAIDELYSKERAKKAFSA